MKQKILNLQIKEILSLYQNGNIDISFDQDMIIGRQDIWSIEKKSMFIHSILSDFLLNPLVFIKKVDFLDINNIEYSVLDGKQRIMTLINYFNNEFTLYEYTPAIKSNKIKGLSFNDLPKKLQDRFLNFKFIVFENEGSFEEHINMYIRYNDGVPIKPIELFRAKLGLHSKLLDEICNHKLFSLINLNGTKRFQNYELALYLLMLESNSKTGLSKREKELFVDKLSKSRSFNKRINENLQIKLDYLSEVFSNPQYLNLNNEDKYLKKSHLISMYLLLDKANKKNISPSQFFTWANNFFLLNKDINNKYWIEVSRGSTTSKNSMKIRNEALIHNFNNFIAEVEKNNNKIISIFTKKTK